MYLPMKTEKKTFTASLNVDPPPTHTHSKKRPNYIQQKHYIPCKV